MSQCAHIVLCVCVCSEKREKGVTPIELRKTKPTKEKKTHPSTHASTDTQISSLSPARANIHCTRLCHGLQGASFVEEAVHGAKGQGQRVAGCA
jgi:hypothetical protein